MFPPAATSEIVGITPKRVEPLTTRFVVVELITARFVVDALVKNIFVAVALVKVAFVPIKFNIFEEEAFEVDARRVAN